jgi:putative hydrolase of the HAD superfamily
VLQAVVFDMDDTLYSEREYVIGGFDAVGGYCEERFGWPGSEIRDALVDMLDRGVRGNTFDLLLRARGVEDAGAVKEMVEAYRTHQPSIRPFPGIVELLNRLRSGHRLGLVSDGYLDVQMRKLEGLGIAPLFDAVVMSDELGRDAWKPSDRPFRLVLERLGVEADEAVYVGENSTKDFLGARKAGMHTIRVLEPAGFYTSVDPPSPEHAADLEVTSLDGLEALLGQWNRSE